MTIPSGGSAGTYLATWNGHGDALALWRVEADGTTTLANSFTYDTWGQPTTTTHSGIADLGFRFLYVGEFDVQWDDSFGLGLLYMHARHYSPSLGRFLQPDPIAAEGNLYGYVENSPVTKVDPSGECGCFIRILESLRSLAQWAQRTSAWQGMQGLFRVAPSVFRLTDSTRRTLVNVATVIDKADKGGRLTYIGRALIKHSSRAGSVFPRVSGSPVEINARAQTLLKAILENPKSEVVTTYTRFGRILDIRDPSGMIVRFIEVRGRIQFGGLREP